MTATTCPICGGDLLPHPTKPNVRGCVNDVTHVFSGDERIGWQSGPETLEKIKLNAVQRELLQAKKVMKVME